MTKRFDAAREAETKFAALIHGGTPVVQAYQQTVGVGRVYANSGSMTSMALRYAKRPYIKSEIDRLANKVRDHFFKKAVYDVEKAMAEADAAIELAKQNGQAGPMVAAVTLKAKLNGLLVEDRRNERTPLTDMSDDQLQQVIDSVAADIASMMPRHAALTEVKTIQ